MKILLHLGMPKCGSSARQTCWSSAAFQKAAKARRVGYVALHEGGRVWSGPDLVARAQASAHGYLSSHAGQELAGMPQAVNMQVRERLLALAGDYDTLILSNEGWGPNPEAWATESLFADRRFEVSALAYVRPQADWMNSAWWQWGAWSDVALPRWVQRNTAKVQWHAILEKWRRKPWIRQVNIRLLPEDVVGDFMAGAGVGLPPQPRVNQGLPGSVLRLFQNNRSLRPGPHDSAIEFALARHLQLSGGQAPWVLRPQLVKHLVEHCRADNESLLAALPPQQQAAMQEDPRWWDAAAYVSRAFQPPGARRMSPDELEALAVAAVRAVERLDAQVRQLQKSAPDPAGAQARRSL